MKPNNIPNQTQQNGFITMIIMIVLILAVVIGYAFLRVSAVKR
jgi:Tfp pilus assembly protein PilX